MSELQFDDPDPLPSDFGYLYGREAPMPFKHYQLLADLAAGEKSSLERHEINVLSNRASRILDAYGEGEPTSRHAYTEDAELHRIVTEAGSHVFGFIDTLEGRTRCRTWVLGGDGVNWCDDEQRYEPAREVEARLDELFPIEESSIPELPQGDLRGIRYGGLRIKRALAHAILR